MSDADLLSEVDDGKKHAAWGPLTWNNYTDDDLGKLLKFVEGQALEWRIAKEVGPTTGTPHLQFALKLRAAWGFKSLKLLFPKIRWQWTNDKKRHEGSGLQGFYGAIAYCGDPTKANGGGVAPEIVSERLPDGWDAGKRPGKRNDLVDARAAAQSGTRVRQFAQTTTSGPALQYFIRYKHLWRNVPRERDVFVTWLFGPTGSGKSRWVTDNTPEDDCYQIGQPPIHRKWEDYDGENHVYWHDPQPTLLSAGEWKNWLDRYVMRVQVNYGHAYPTNTHWYITADKPPHEFFAVFTEEDQAQIMRRIHKILHKPSFDAPVVEVPKGWSPPVPTPVEFDQARLEPAFIHGMTRGK